MPNLTFIILLEWCLGPVSQQLCGFDRIVSRDKLLQQSNVRRITHINLAEIVQQTRD